MNRSGSGTTSETVFSYATGTNISLKRDSMVTMLSWQWDDGLRALIDSGYVDSFQVHNQPFSWGIIAWKALRGDTSGTYTSAERLRTLRNRKITNEQGVETNLISFLGHGYGQDTMQVSPLVRAKDLWNVDASLYRMPQGKWSALNWYEFDAHNCYLALKDTIFGGSYVPRGWVSPNSSAFRSYTTSISKYFDYQITSGQTASGHSIRFSYQLFPYRLDNGLFPRVSGYPGDNISKYDIYYPLSESLGWAQFQERLTEAIAIKGSWIVFVGHNPATLVASTGKDFGTILSYVDSLVSIGKLRVVHADEGFDLSYNSTISPGANLIYPNLDDNDLDGKPDMVEASYATFYPESVYVEGGGDNHGIFGNGYFTLDWGQAGYDQDVSFTDPPTWWYNVRDFQWRLPAGPFRGKRIYFEMQVQIDPSIEDVATTPLSSSDSIGVVFEGMSELRPSLQGGSEDPGGYGLFQGITNLRTIDLNYRYNKTIQYGLDVAATFEADDTVGGSWMYYYAVWDVPQHCDYVFINIVKDSRFDSGSVRITNPFVGVDDM